MWDLGRYTDPQELWRNPLQSPLYNSCNTLPFSAILFVILLICYTIYHGSLSLVCRICLSPPFHTERGRCWPGAYTKSAYPSTILSWVLLQLAIWRGAYGWLRVWFKIRRGWKPIQTLTQSRGRRSTCRRYLSKCRGDNQVQSYPLFSCSSNRGKSRLQGRWGTRLGVDQP